VLAWRVSEGDVSPSGAWVVSVQRDPSRGHVRLGFSDGSALDVAGERRVMVWRRRPLRARAAAGAVFLGGVRLARRRVEVGR